MCDWPPTQRAPLPTLLDVMAQDEPHSQGHEGARGTQGIAVKGQGRIATGVGEGGRGWGRVQQGVVRAGGRESKRQGAGANVEGQRIADASGKREVGCDPIFDFEDSV